MKKVYLSPTLEILEFEAEMLIAASEPKPGIGSGDGSVSGGGGFSNKRQPIGGTWNSDNWNQVEE